VSPSDRPAEPNSGSRNPNTLFLKVAIQSGLLDSAAGDRILGSIAERREIGVEKHAWEVAVELELMTHAAAEKVREAIRGNATPEQIGGFRLEKLIGRGAVGTVYRANQLSLDKTVAVKLLHPNHTAKEHFVADFLREAKAVAKLNHPNIVHAIDAGEVDGRYFFAMEFVDGETLRTKLTREKQLSPAETVAIGQQIAAGLAHAHGSGLIHRDLKPDNVLIGKEGRARIADLGLAIPVDDAELLAAEHKKQGTPFYLSPEAARGESLDARSDLYSFGALLYHCLAGKPVFTGQSVKEIFTKHVHQEAVPIGELSEAPAPLERIVMKLLEKDPESRYGSADEVILALEAAEKTTGTPAAPASSRGTAPRRGAGRGAGGRSDARASGGAKPKVGGARPKGRSRGDARPAGSSARRGSGPSAARPASVAAARPAAPSARPTFQRKSKVVSNSGLGLGIAIAALVTVGQLTGAQSPEETDLIRRQGQTEEERRVIELKIERRIQEYEDRVKGLETAAKSSLDSAPEIPDVAFRRRCLENWLYTHCVTTQAIPMMDMLDQIAAENRAARIEGPMEYLQRARDAAAEGRLSAAVEILDGRPRAARKDAEMNTRIEEYLSELEEEIAAKEEADLAEANACLNRKDYPAALVALERIEVYGDKKALEKATKLREQVLKEQAEYVRTERDRALRGERQEYAAVLGKYRAAVLERGFKEAISTAVEFQARVTSDEVRGRVERDIEAFSLLDQFRKDALAELESRKERGEEAEIVLKPVGESTRGKRYRGQVDRIEGDDVFIQVDGATFPLDIGKFDDQTVFDLVRDRHGEKSPAYLVPLGLLFGYRGFGDIARTHFDLAAAEGTNPDTWIEHLDYLKGLSR